MNTTTTTKPAMRPAADDRLTGIHPERCGCSGDRSTYETRHGDTYVLCQRCGLVDAYTVNPDGPRGLGSTPTRPRIRPFTSERELPAIQEAALQSMPRLSLDESRAFLVEATHRAATANHVDPAELAGRVLDQIKRWKMGER